ncbi:MAG: PAS domain S-box protein [bacterium]
MSTAPVTRQRDRVALPFLLLIAVVLGGGVFLRVRYLQREMLSRWNQALVGGALTTQATVDEWFTERRADAEALATTLAIHGALHNAGGDARRPFAQVLAPVTRRGRFIGLWVLDSAGGVIASSTQDSLRHAELIAFRASVSSGSVATSAVIPLGPHAAIFSLAAPVHITTAAAGVPHPFAVVLRADIVAAFAPWARGRPNAAMSLFASPSPDGAVLLTACPGQPVPVCVASPPAQSTDAAATLALARVDSFGLFRSFQGEQVLAVTRFDRMLGWGVVRRVRYNDARVPLWTELAIEGAFFAVLLTLFAVATYAANRTVRVRRLSALREADERVAVVLDASTDGIISLDESYAITMVNTAIERMLGYSRGELVGRPIFSVFAARWHAPLTESLQALSNSAGTRAPLADTERCIALCADGSLLPVDARVGRTLHDGAPLFVMGLRDVSERARSELFLQGQRQVLELIATGAPAPDTISELLGVLEGEALHMRTAVFETGDERQIARLVAAPSLPPDFVNAFVEIVVGATSGVVGSAIFRGESVFTPEVATDPLWDGAHELAASHGISGAWAIPLRAADGHVIGALACYYAESRHPTTRERELARAAVHLASIALSSSRDAESLRTSEASFRSFVENAPAAIFRETRGGVLVSTNPAMVSLLGYRNAAELARAADAGRLYRDVDARTQLLVALEREDIVRGHEVEWLRANGSLVTVRVSAHAYRDDRGEVWLWEGYAEDVTSLRATESALRRSERLAAVGQLISGVAHELNNPLSSIMHFTEDLLSDERSSADAEALGVIRDQARRSRAIVRDLLTFVRQREVTSEALPLGDVVASTTRAMRPSLERDGVSLHLDAGAPGALVLADRSGVEQIVTNLVINAAQAAGRGGHVWICAGTRDGNCVMTVEDSGRGVPADVLPQIFDPFFTTKPTGEGTGLGLSVTLGIVEQFGGRITVDSKIAGRGARFTVFLPRMDPSTTPVREVGESLPPMAEEAATPILPEPIVPPNDQQALRTALIIDDEPTIRAALRRYFMRRGWAVEEAPDGAAGLKLIESHGDRFGVIISDLRMPGFSGIELHDQLAVEHPEVLLRIVFSTGDVASAEAASFVQRTTCPVLQKPFELHMLDSIIAGVVDGAGAERVIT